MIRLWSICKNTFAQTVRQPIFGVLILVTFAILLTSLPLSGWTMGTNYRETDQKMFESVGLSTLLLSGLLIAAFSASSVLAREIDDKTALTVISKPVSRPTFVLGKFMGVTAAVTLAFYVCSLVFLLLVRHGIMSAITDPYDWPVIVLGLSAFGLAMLIAILGNFFFGWSIVSAGLWANVLLLSIAMAAISFIGKKWEIVPLGYHTAEKVAINGQLLLGLSLIFMAAMIFVGVAVASSTRLGQVMTLSVCFAVFFIGSIHPWLVGYLATKIPAVKVVGWIVPNLTYFYPLDALADDSKHIPIGYVGTAGGYCALYIGATLAIGMAMFQRRPLESQSSGSSLPGPVALLAWTGRIASIAAWITAAALFTLPAFHNPSGLAMAAGIVVASGLNWAMWSVFATGAKWGYWMVLTMVVFGLLGFAIPTFAPNLIGYNISGDQRVAFTIATIVALMIVVMLILPGARRHFKSAV